jgi:hypothetical protein
MAYLEQTQLTDIKDVVIDPAENETIIWLRRVVKLLEPSSTVDTANRQRVVVDTIAGGTITTVTAVTAITNALPAGTNSLGYIGMISDTRTDLTRNTYANGIRRNLTFS